MNTMEEISIQVKNLQTDLTDHTENEKIRDIETAIKIASLEEKMELLLVNTQSLLSLWEQARGMVTLVKWLAAISGSLASIYLFFKGK